MLSVEGGPGCPDNHVIYNYCFESSQTETDVRVCEKAKGKKELVGCECERQNGEEGREGGRAGEERNDGEALKDKEKMGGTGGVGGERLTEYVKGGKEKGGRRKEGEKGEEKKSMAI